MRAMRGKSSFVDFDMDLEDETNIKTTFSPDVSPDGNTDDRIYDSFQSTLIYKNEETSLTVNEDSSDNISNINDNAEEINDPVHSEVINVRGQFNGCESEVKIETDVNATSPLDSETNEPSPEELLTDSLYLESSPQSLTNLNSTHGTNNDTITDSALTSVTKENSANTRSNGIARYEDISDDEDVMECVNNETNPPTPTDANGKCIHVLIIDTRNGYVHIPLVQRCMFNSDLEENRNFFRIKQNYLMVWLSG